MLDAAAGASEPPQGEAGPAHRGSLRVAVALTALMVLASTAGFLAHERRQELASARASGIQRVDHLADEVSAALALAGVAVARLDARLDALPPGAPAAAALAAAAAEQGPLLAGLPMPMRVAALDLDGRPLAGPETAPRVPDERPPLPPGTAWQVGPTRGPPGARSVPLWRPARPDRHGVTAFEVHLDHAALLARLAKRGMAWEGSAALLRLDADGAPRVLASAPHDEAELERVAPGPLAQLLAGSPRGAFEGPMPTGRGPQIVAYRRLEGDAASLVVAYGVSTEAVLADWQAQLPWAGGTVVLLLGAIFAGARRLERSLQAQARQQRALQRSESQVRTLADNLPDVVVRLDQEGRHHFANAAVQQATGLPPEAFIGKTNAELGMPADKVAQWMAVLRRVFEHGRAERVEFDYDGPQGLRHWESVVAPEARVAGEPPTALVISRDISERRDAENARTALHRRLAEVLESMSDGFVSLGRDWRYVAVNRRAGELLGRDAASLVGRHIWTEFPEGVGQPFHRAYERAMNEGATVVLEEHYTPWDRWFENRIYPSADGISIFFTDITERRRAAEALGASEVRHRELFEANPHPMWVFDLETLTFLAVNDAAVRQYGYSRDEFLGMTIKDIRPPDDVPRLLANVAQVNAGLDDAGTWRHRTRDGRLLEVEITSHTLAFHGRPAELVLAHDVTRRNQGERTRHDSEERLRLALQAANQGLYDLDLRSGEAVVSPEYARMLGWEPQDFRETHAAWRDRLHPDDREAVFRAFDDYVTGRRDDYRVEFRQRTRDGHWKWILSVGRIQARDAEGRPLRMLGTHTDLDTIKAAQAAQVAATQRFEKLFLAAPEAISVSELDSGRFLQVNDAFCELFGYTREQVIGRTSFDLAMWRHTTRRDAIVEQLRAGHTVQGVEGVARRRSGERIDVLFSAERIDFDAGDALLLMFRDISQRKQLEAALRASESRLEYLLSRVPTVVYTARVEGDFGATYYSPNLPDMLGWQPQAFLEDGAFWLNHLHPDDRAGVLHALESLATRDDLLLEYRFLHADGRWRWMRDQLRVQRDAQGRAIELVGAWIDITERREAEEQVRHLAAELEQRVHERTAQLASSEARYRAIFETVPVSIGEEDWSGVQQRLRALRAQGVRDGPGHFAARPDFVHDCLRAVKVRRLNRKALALHDAGDTPAEVPDLRAFFPSPVDEDQFVVELEAMWAGQRLVTAKRTLPSVTGRPLSLMMTMSLPGLDDDDGTALVCLVDITEIDRLNAELDRSVERLKQVNRELETFTYSVSHDLKAPLRGIDGYSRLLLSDHFERLDDEGRQFLHHIRQATQHMGALIDDLLTYSRQERRELAIAPQPLADVVDRAVAGLRQDLDRAGVQLALHIDPGLRARADAQGLTLALRNLIDNAVKFSRASQPPRITIEAARSKDGIELAVRDNGVGFDMKFHDRIFSIFQRLHRAEDYPGTGIGLAIVRKAMERMHGRVRADSRPGEGATFILSLPQADEP